MTRLFIFIGTLGGVVGFLACTGDRPDGGEGGRGGACTTGCGGAGAPGGQGIAGQQGDGAAPVGGSGGISSSGLAGTGGALGSGSGGAVAAGGAGALTGAGGTPPSCGTAQYTATALAPDILILLDRSGSMANDIDDRSCMLVDPTTGAITARDCGASSKWALTTPVIDQAVTANESSVNWGLKYFADPGNSTCSVSNTVQVPAAPQNAAAIRSAIAAETNGQGSISNGSRTPTRLAVQRAAGYLSTLSAPSRKLILLATDGLPNCAPGTSGTSDDSIAAIGAVQEAAAMGIGTFVVGIATAGMGTADATLSQMALAGGLARADVPYYYSASTPGELSTALQTLVSLSKQPCTLVLPATPTQDGTTSPDRIKVYADGVLLARDTNHAEGWDYADGTPTAITVYGAACAGLKNGTIGKVTIEFFCFNAP